MKVPRLCDMCLEGAENIPSRRPRWMILCGSLRGALYGPLFICDPHLEGVAITARLRLAGDQAPVLSQWTRPYGQIKFDEYVLHKL